MEHFDIQTGIVIGVCATIVMDLWLVIANRLFGFDKPNWRPVGRWVIECMHGRVIHEDISLARSYAYENQVGWSFHYVVGAVYGLFFLYLISVNWIDLPLIISALLFGSVTISAGWFFLHPCIGLGIALTESQYRCRYRIDVHRVLPPYVSKNFTEPSYQKINVSKKIQLYKYCFYKAFYRQSNVDSHS